MNRTTIYVLIGSVSFGLLVGLFTIFKTSVSGSPSVVLDTELGLCEDIFGYKDAQEYELVFQDMSIGSNLEDFLNELRQGGVVVAEAPEDITLRTRYSFFRSGEQADLFFDRNIDSFAMRTGDALEATTHPPGNNISILSGGNFHLRVWPEVEPPSVKEVCIRLLDGQVIESELQWRGLDNMNAALQLRGKDILSPDDDYGQEGTNFIALNIADDINLASIGGIYLVDEDENISEIEPANTDDVQKQIWIAEDLLSPGRNMIILGSENRLYQIVLDR